MPLGSEKDEGEVAAGTDRSEAERLLEETRRMLDNTRSFLRQIRDGEEASRQYIEDLKRNLENDVRRLEQKRLENEASIPRGGGGKGLNHWSRSGL